jgi:hypothetical protein
MSLFLNLPDDSKVFAALAARSNAPESNLKHKGRKVLLLYYFYSRMIQYYS